jgi:prophage antirepressor-like protein
MATSSITNESVKCLKDDINSVIIVETIKFNNRDINVYGTIEDPLFKAKDIGSLLEIDQIRKTLNNIDENDKLLILGPGNNVTGDREQYFVTEFGLYEILFISRKPLAKEFKLYVKNILKDLRLNRFNILKNEYDNKLLQIKGTKELDTLKFKNEQNLRDYENQSGAYIFILEPTKDDEYIYCNFGSTSNITERMKDHRTNFRKINKEAYLYLFYPTVHYLKAEQKIKNEVFIVKHKINYDNHIEMFAVKNENESYNLVNKVFKSIFSVFNQQFGDDNNFLELEKEKTRQIEAHSKVKQEEEKTKQLEIEHVNKTKQILGVEEEKTKQEELKLKQLELQLELKKLELKQSIEPPEIPDDPSNKPSTSSTNIQEEIIEENKETPTQINFINRPNKSSSYIGVVKKVNKGKRGDTVKYEAKIYHNKYIFLGSYPKEEIAAYAYDCARTQLFGDKFSINNVDKPQHREWNNETMRLDLVS